MIIQHNLSALNANRQLNIVRKTGSKSAEKLSSGYRINRAADDAAGLSISEKMRKQIRGLTKAKENVEDGISLCQVADGAMAEMHDMTNRMNELCVQAANGTNSADDRSYIQMEIDNIVEEFGRIINTTKFNEVYIWQKIVIYVDILQVITQKRTADIIRKSSGVAKNTIKFATSMKVAKIIRQKLIKKV